MEVRERMVRFLQELELNKNLNCKSLKKEEELKDFILEIKNKLSEKEFIELEDLICEALLLIKEDYFTFGSLSEKQ